MRKKKNIEREDTTEKEKEPVIMNEMQLVQERDNEDPEGEEAHASQGKETDIWEDYDGHEHGKEEANTEDVKNAAPEKDHADKGDKEDTARGCVTEKDKEPGIVSEMMLVLERENEDAESKEENPAEEGTAMERECEYETEKETGDEVNSVPSEKENSEQEERQDFEEDVEKEDISENINLPSLSKLMPLSQYYSEEQDNEREDKESNVFKREEGDSVA
ncbi:high mobility group nucleosome-binding domain-containing protein 5-like [Scylla paramamosain]|uniref:high mobility group nucleosome-binding domain-containing protein 5-like n=1 Tax=Scylla paramamosain TaxID=85552 RepID=UPI003083EB9B